jgi:hypothetical protein
MTDTEDLVRSTTSARAGTVQHVRPLEPLLQAAELDGISPPRGGQRAGWTARRAAGPSGGWVRPLAAGGSVAAIALAAVLVAHMTGRAGTQAADSAGASLPEFYMTETYVNPSSRAMQFQVRRTRDGAVTSSWSISGANRWLSAPTAVASDRAFYYGSYAAGPCRHSQTVPITTFYRITITGSGRISGVAPVGVPVRGAVSSLEVSPDGSQMAYNVLARQCGGPLRLSGAVSVMNLSTGAVRTWQDTAGKESVNKGIVGRDFAREFSWAPNGRALIVDELPAAYFQSTDLTVFRLNTTGSGGSIQDHSTILLRQDLGCSTTCVATTLAGPGDSLTALEYQAVGTHEARQLVVRISPGAGAPRTVLYSNLVDAPLPYDPLNPPRGLLADPSGQWLLVWPETSGNPDWHGAGWISAGLLHPLPGAGQVSPYNMAW